MSGLHKSKGYLVDFSSPCCGHKHHGSYTVTFGSKGSIFCTDCYASMLADEEAGTEKRFGPPIHELCIICGEDNGCTRFDPDLGSGLCDGCRKRNDAEIKSHEDAQLLEARKGKLPAVEPDAVCPGIYVGPKESAYDKETLRRLGITHILLCCTDLPAIHQDDLSITYHRLAIRDSLTQDLLPYLPSARAFITAALSDKGKVLVHCNAGISRSGAIAVYWVMHTRASGGPSGGKESNSPSDTMQSVDVDKALTAVRRRRPSIRPNSNFMSQLRIAEKQLKEGCC
jgi:hypothetical protein